eukprot:4142418-Alexandrium_andersonii.AAC.1
MVRAIASEILAPHVPIVRATPISYLFFKNAAGRPGREHWYVPKFWYGVMAWGAARCDAQGLHHAGFRPAGGPLSAAAP